MSAQRLVRVVAFFSVLPVFTAHAADVTLAWDPVTAKNLTGYRLYYGPSAATLKDGTGAVEGPSPVEVPLTSLTNTQAPEFTLHGLDSCAPYYFGTTAYDAADPKRESPYSNILGPHFPVAKPTVTLSAGSGGLQVSWTGKPANDAGTLSGYRIKYGSQSGVYDGTIAREGPSPLSVTANVTSLALSGIPMGTTLFVVVEATCAGGPSKTSEEVSFTLQSPVCGNGHVEGNETCDPPGSCPVSCDDNDVCTTDATTGSAATCNLSCSNAPITRCIGGDGCCPAGCGYAVDDDCTHPADVGVLPKDAGWPIADAQRETPEAGTPATDSLASARDAGASTADSIMSIRDAGPSDGSVADPKRRKLQGGGCRMVSNAKRPNFGFLVVLLAGALLRNRRGVSR